MEDLATIISTVGFPIAAFLLIFWYMSVELKEFRDIVSQNTEVLIELKSVLLEQKKNDVREA